VPGHGSASPAALDDLRLTRDYLADLRRQMGQAVEAMLSFEDAYASADWSAWSSLPAFEEAHRRNAYNVYLQMEREALEH